MANFVLLQLSGGATTCKTSCSMLSWRIVLGERMSPISSDLETFRRVSFQIRLRQLYVESRKRSLLRIQWEAYTIRDTPCCVDIWYVQCALPSAGSYVSILGPVSGGPFLDDDQKLRAIAREYWHKICPEPMTVWTYDLKKIINNNEATAGTILKTWVDYFSTIDQPCVQIDGGVERIFDM